MHNNIRSLEKDLRTLSKRNKNVTYTKDLLVIFLITGTLSMTTWGITPVNKSTNFEKKYIVAVNNSQSKSVGQASKFGNIKVANQTTTQEIEGVRKSIDTSISTIQKDFKTFKAENDKLLRASKLELIQLMEQGDHVVKSPWSSWQYGLNFFYGDYNGVYKGRGDKEEKYPYEGIFERSIDPFKKFISPASKRYSLLSESTTPNSASSNSRKGLPNGYGIGSTIPASEPMISFEVSASINPRNVVLPTIMALGATQPVLPGTIDFNPTTPKMSTPTAPTLNLPTISAPATGNEDSSWVAVQPNNNLNRIAVRNKLLAAGLVTGSGYGQAVISAADYLYDETAWLNELRRVDSNSKVDKLGMTSTNGFLPGTMDEYAGSSTVLGSGIGYQGVGAIAQQDMEGGTLTVTANGTTFDMDSKGITYTGRYNRDHNASNLGRGLLDFSSSGYASYAVMKLVAGHTIKVSSDINYTGSGLSNYSRWLFHTDGHNYFGDSTWLTSGNIALNGNNLVLYTSQYHQGSTMAGNIGFINNGNIITKGSDNIGWVALDEWGNLARVAYFQNKGSIDIGGTKDMFVYMMAGNSSTANRDALTPGRFSIINDGKLVLSGNDQYGIIISPKFKYISSEILLNTPMEITGNGTTGIAFGGYSDLDGGGTFSRSTANNIELILPATTRASIINIDITGNKNTGMFFEYDGSGVGTPTATTPFVINNYKINVDGDENTGVFVKDGAVTLGTGTANDINLNTGKNNIGIFTAGADPINSAANISVKSENSTAIYSKNSTGTVTSTGAITATGSAVRGIVSDNSNITSTGQINITGTELDANTGSIGIVALNGGTATHSGGGKIAVDGSASLGAYSGTGSTINLSNGVIETKGSAINIYSEGGTTNINGTNVKTGQGSLAFMVDNTGIINFNGATIADIAGGTSPNTRGTAFMYTGSNKSSFTASDITTWASNRFAGSFGNLTLNMASGSRLFIAQDVSMNLSDTASSTLASAVPVIINGTDYKSFMLYKSLLKLDQSINLDDPNDAFNVLEISNSSIDNTNNNTISGTQLGQTAMAQENKSATNISDVTVSNNGIINLSGINSTAIYTKYGILNNNATGVITLRDSSTALYGTADSILNNTGVIELGSQSTGMYSEGSTTQGITNAGTIKGTGTNSVAVMYKPDSTIPAGTLISNVGTIIMGDQSMGLYGDGTNSQSFILDNTGDITVGKQGIGMYGYEIQLTSGTITVGDRGVGIYSQSKDVNLNGGTIVTNKDTAIGAYVLGSGQTINNIGTTFSLGETSIAIVNTGNGNIVNSTVGNVSLGKKNVYVYSSDITGTVNNSTNLITTGSQNYGIYSAGNVLNTGNIEFGSGIGNVGMYSIGGGTASNNGVITIGGSDTANQFFGIGMAAGYQTSDTGNVINTGTINVNGINGIGMYGSGVGTTVTNNGIINLNANGTTGIFLDNGATGINNGTINTVATGLNKISGVYVTGGATLVNNGNILIDATNSKGVYLKGGTVRNYGTIEATGTGSQNEYTFKVADTSKDVVGGIKLDTKSIPPVIIRNDVVVQPTMIFTDMTDIPKAVATSSIGMYVDTSGISFTNPIGNIGSITDEADLIIGTEATKYTNAKDIMITDSNIILPYYNSMIANPQVTNWSVYSAGLTWSATGRLDNSGYLTSILMSKIPYTAWAGNDTTPVNSTDTYNFLDGLEQRYGVDALHTRENQLFQKLNGIGKNEEILFYQAVDEMMGHQYGNVQQRIYATGNTLDKEFNHLQKDWRNPSKQNNKIKVFGMRDEYKTDTAGIIDYTSNTYGVAYVHEDETVKLGNSNGWYAGAVHNRFKLKDIGGSKENQSMIKAGIFKTMSPAADHNGALQWTISGDVFAGMNEMKRRYLVVDEIFNAEADYNSYGFGIKNELGYDIRLSERTHLRPYGSLKMEYGRFSNIKENNGEVRLEVEGNDYYSIKPEVGLEFKYIQPMAVRTNLSVGLTAAYETELGKVNDVDNRGRVRYTNADWFGIRGEKEDRRGSGKFDLNIGVDNTRFGVTVNAGYDTDGENIRGGIGFRAIY